MNKIIIFHPARKQRLLIPGNCFLMVVKEIRKQTIKLRSSGHEVLFMFVKLHRDDGSISLAKKDR